jgi:hypothetical protein
MGSVVSGHAPRRNFDKARCRRARACPCMECNDPFGCPWILATIPAVIKKPQKRIIRTLSIRAVQRQAVADNNTLSLVFTSTAPLPVITGLDQNRATLADCGSQISIPPMASRAGSTAPPASRRRCSKNLKRGIAQLVQTLPKSDFDSPPP